MKQKRCKCGKDYTQFTTLQGCCVDCLAEKIAKQRINSAKVAQKHEKRELAKQKEAIKSRSDWMKEVQQAFNSWIRERDKDKPCISCQRYHTGQYHAGHYRTTAAAPELRFNELNVHKQCSACNNHKHGNITEYRINLVKCIGIELVEWIEGSHPPKKYSIEDLKAIKAEYKQKLKQLLNN